MFIVPISSTMNTVGIQSLKLSSDKLEASPDGKETLGFNQLFQEAIQNAEATEAITQEDAYNLSIGNMDDMHTLMINSAKAEVALQTMVQLRNKFLDAYSEIMRTNL